MVYETKEADRDQLLIELVHLSEAFGGPDYVKAGGGNASVKIAGLLYIKPSGVPLRSVTIGSLVAVDRSRLTSVYQIQPDIPSSQREALVKGLIMEAVVPGCMGRPSVETPLHDCLSWRFIVHTHPPLVNGLTCSVSGPDACRRLFPDALWVDYVDPGYRLCVELQRSIRQYRARYNYDPQVIFLQNHGLVVAADTPSRIHLLHRQVMDLLARVYKEAGVPMVLPKTSLDQTTIQQATGRLRAAFDQEVEVQVGCSLGYPQGPLTPDHIVYARSFPLEAEPSRKTIRGFYSRYGYEPRIVAWDGLVCGVGNTVMQARLALELAEDGGLVRQLAEAFGGVRYMSEQARLFIEHWEAEAYRLRMLESDRS